MLDPDLEPDISHLVIEDDEPVDNLFCERQQRLLVEPLYASWTREGGRPFVAHANVGLFFALHQPPMVPDVLLSLDVRPRPDLRQKRNRTYLIWEFGKAPDVVIEVVSNRTRHEEEKIVRYADLGIPYYAIYDPEGHLSRRPLRVYQHHGKRYVEMLDPSVLPDVGLGLVLWEGEYEDYHATWLRWCDAEGRLLETGAESAAVARVLAADAEHRAAAAEARAAALAERLRALGGDPD